MFFSHHRRSCDGIEKLTTLDYVRAWDNLDVSVVKKKKRMFVFGVLESLGKPTVTQHLRANWFSL